MILNCSEFGLDYRTASLSEYLEAYEARAESNDGPKKESDPDWLASMMAMRVASERLN